MTTVTKLAIVIPARAGSVGITDKNLQQVDGKELLIRSIEHGKFLSKLLDCQIIVSSDSQDTLALVRKKFGLSHEISNPYLDFQFYEGLILHHRPAPLATSESLIMETMYAVRTDLKGIKLFFSDWCLLQPTSPFRSKKGMVELAEKISAATNQSIISLTPVIGTHPARMYQVLADEAIPLSGYETHYYKKRQDLPPVFVRDGAYYVMSDQLVNQKTQYSGNPDCIIQGYPWNINIDEPEDLALARLVSREMFADDPNS